MAHDVVTDQIHSGAAPEISRADVIAAGGDDTTVLQQSDLGQFGADVNDQQGSRMGAGPDGGSADGVDEQQPGRCEDRVQHAAGEVLIGAGRQDRPARHDHPAGRHRLRVLAGELRQQGDAAVDVDDAAPAYQ
jgi:hypothetical protein